MNAIIDWLLSLLLAALLFSAFVYVLVLIIYIFAPAAFYVCSFVDKNFLKCTGEEEQNDDIV